jgi:hypothetical protein
MRNSGFALCSVLSITACGVGHEEMNTPDEFLCHATLAITGTFTRGMAVPDLVNNETGMTPGDGEPDYNGCWPTGTWVFKAAVEDSTCGAGPTPESEYRFTTTFNAAGSDGQGGEFAYQLQSPALTENYRLKVSSGGGGECEGVMELYVDGAKKAWYLHPALDAFNMDAPLSGVGEYEEFDHAIYP